MNFMQVKAFVEDNLENHLNEVKEMQKQIHALQIKVKALENPISTGTLLTQTA